MKNIVEIKENASNQHFPKVFSKGVFLRYLKVRTDLLKYNPEILRLLNVFYPINLLPQNNDF